VSGDYLWDKSGPRDPEVERIERVLGTLAQPDPPPALRRPAASVVTRSRMRPMAFVMALSGIAATIAIVGFSWWAERPASSPAMPGLTVVRVAGAPTIESRAMDARGELQVGRWLETDKTARASVDVGDIGRVEIDPDTRIGLVSTSPTNYRLQLARGTLHALIWAPPGQFFVETSSSTAVDLGCAYTMNMNDEGIGVVKVTSGWVGFEWQGHESFIPAGAVCITRPGLGPGTPHFEDTSAAFQAALDVIDLGRGSPDAKIAAIGRVLAESRERDKVTLWHLLSRVDESQRDRVFDRLAAFAPPPVGVTRDGIRAGGKNAKDMLDKWWDALGLGTASWWRTWKQQWK
jgi:hypothetical protein